MIVIHVILTEAVGYPQDAPKACVFPMFPGDRATCSHLAFSEHTFTNRQTILILTHIKIEFLCTEMLSKIVAPHSLRVLGTSKALPLLELPRNVQK